MEKPLLGHVEKPLLLVDVDGVISLFGFDPSHPPRGTFQFVDGIPHYLSATAGEHLRQLSEAYELTWCTGWEEKANEYLPFALGLTGTLPLVAFDACDRPAGAHWKLAGIGAYDVEPTRPLAWLDDAHDEHCTAWATARSGPTLLVTTEPAVGLTDEHVAALREWGQSNEPWRPAPPRKRSSPA